MSHQFAATGADTKIATLCCLWRDVLICPAMGGQASFDMTRAYPEQKHGVFDAYASKPSRDMIIYFLALLQLSRNLLELPLSFVTNHSMKILFSFSASFLMLPSLWNFGQCRNGSEMHPFVRLELSSSSRYATPNNSGWLWLDTHQNF